VLKLDHVAIATDDHRPVVEALVGRLGALVISGGAPENAGFRAVQLRVGRGSEGMTVEVLEPYRPERNDFLTRFLADRGPGVHHLTFKSADVVAERRRLAELGVEVVAVDFDGPWKEMFIHPRDAHGTLVQIAQSDWTSPPMEAWLGDLPGSVQLFDGTAPWWTAPEAVPAAQPATLERVVVETPDLFSAEMFYGAVLGAEASGELMKWRGGAVLLEDGPARAHVTRLEITGAPSTFIGGVRFVAV